MSIGKSDDLRPELAEISPVAAVAVLMPPDDLRLRCTVRQKRVDKNGETYMKTLASINQGTAQRIETDLRGTDIYRAVNSAVESRTPDTFGLSPKRHLRSLNAAYSDVDFYKAEEDLNFEQALSAVHRLVRGEMLPPPSIIVDSGRGAYLLWRLHEENSRDTGVKITGADDPRLRIYEACQRKLQIILAMIGADPNATDPARVLRTPGSINGIATSLNGGEPVICRYYLGYIDAASPTLEAASYTLGEFADALGVNVQALTGRVTMKLGSCEARQRGQQGLGKKRVEAIEGIWEEVGYPQQGHRRRALLAYASHLRILSTQPDEMHRKLTDAAQQCRPPYPTTGTNDVTVGEIIREARNGLFVKKYNDETLCGVLRIDPASAPPSAAPIIPKAKPVRFSTKEARTPRQQFARRLLAAHPTAAAREVHRQAQAAGHACSLETICKDLREIQPHRARTAKPKKAKVQQPTLFEPADLAAA
jgi:hypothetical protein